jgi:hypothetical protein
LELPSRGNKLTFGALSAVALLALGVFVAPLAVFASSSSYDDHDYKSYDDHDYKSYDSYYYHHHHKHHHHDDDYKDYKSYDDDDDYSYDSYDYNSYDSYN